MENNQNDDKNRGATGVVCSIHALSNGKLRVVMDDVVNSCNPDQGPWKHEVLVTWKDYDLSELANLEVLSESELASFGHYILARLMAHSRAGI
jgi:hypothetical protein